MNVLQESTKAINECNEVMRLAALAREAFALRRSMPSATISTPKHTIHMGAGMVRVINTATQRVVGFRQTYKEAMWLAQSLEREATA
ncbi:hypothetical protein [Pseudomonas sp.]|jgi:hypothetical protein|uniref:hypothetical protein n=1 Tax=Pseudomonas sp. TaxID=306 RepID=UPI0025800BB2|nr:hypothetical protein [Pseudomonas sp.]